MAVVGSNAVVALQIGKVPTALPAIRAEMHLNLLQTSLALSALNVMGATVAFTVPIAARFVGARRLALTALGCMALGSLGGSVSARASELLATRVTEGLGCLLMMIAGPAVLAEILDRRRLRLVLGILPAATPAGIALMLVAGPAISSHTGWRGVWILTAVAAALAFAGLALATREAHAIRTQPPTIRISRRLRTGSRARRLNLLCLATISVCYSGQFIGVLGLLPTLLLARVHLSIVVAGFLTAAAFIANSIVSTIAGLLQHRGVPGWQLIVGGGLAMAPCLWLVYDPNVPLAVAVGAVWTFAGCGGFIASAVMNGAARHVSDQGHVVSNVALFTQAINIGQLIGPLVVAAVEASSSWTSIPLALNVPAIAILVGGVALRYREPRTSTSSAAKEVARERGHSRP